LLKKVKKARIFKDWEHPLVAQVEIRIKNYVFPVSKINFSKYDELNKIGMNYRLYQYYILACMIVFAVSCKDNGDDNVPQGTDCVSTGKPDTLHLPGNQLKGWEVYSWPACGGWNFSLLYGTNALKNYEEVTGQQSSGRFVIRVWGKNDLKKVLLRIPAGEAVSLVGEGWLQQTWGAGTYGNLRLPPATIMNELQQTAAQASLDWQVLN
jgi:hypothetical protein